MPCSFDLPKDMSRRAASPSRIPVTVLLIELTARGYQGGIKILKEFAAEPGQQPSAIARWVFLVRHFVVNRSKLPHYVTSYQVTAKAATNENMDRK